MIALDTPVAAVLGDRKAKREKVEKGLGLRTVGDLLAHHPRRYLRTGELTRVADLQEGQLLTVVGEIVHSKVHAYTDRRTGKPAYRLETRLKTSGPSLSMTFFAKSAHVSQWQARRLEVGRTGLFLGKAGRFRDEWQLTNPTMLVFGWVDEEETRAAADQIRGLYPLYPLTRGVDHWDLQRAVTFARSVVDELPEVVPPGVRERYDVLDAHQALEWIHAPDDQDQVARARRRYRFEEALVTQVVLGRRRRAVAALGARPRDGGAGALLAAFDARLPFELTGGQVAIGRQVDADLARPHPMNRLLQGEVGSGKTLVALRAMLRVVDSGGQAALLAPTEVLAQQHHRSITAMLGDLADGGVLGSPAEATRVELLTGSMSTARRREALLRIASGEAGLVVGTHALLEDRVSFADLGLVVVDEQHRFGVEQRAALTDKAGTPPHVLVMTATPIPRTVAMTVFGDLEISTLRELPAGRAAVQTTAVHLADNPSWLGRVWSRVAEEVAAGHRVYVVCPRISADVAEQGERDAPEELPEVDPFEDDLFDGPAGGPPPPPRVPPPPLSAVDEVATMLREGPLRGLRVGVLHGRMPAEEKDLQMTAFARGDTDVLVATTVVEVGLDVPEATAMVLLDADRFGVSQLHQLRGRVGRGGLPGLCLLVSHSLPGTPARERLDAVAATRDGFELSRVDLEQRREGDVLGRSQSGFRSGLQVLRVLRDEQTITEAREAAEELLDTDPDLTGAPDLAHAVDGLERSTASDYMDKS